MKLDVPKAEHPKAAYRDCRSSEFVSCQWQLIVSYRIIVIR